MGGEMPGEGPDRKDRQGREGVPLGHEGSRVDSAGGVDKGGSPQLQRIDDKYRSIDCRSWQMQLS